MPLTIDAIVLNWNRAALLDRCLGSLFSTAADHVGRCIVVDNDSRDASHAVIARHAAAHSQLVPMLMHENRGAEWLNDAFATVDADLVLILANDKELLPGWVEYTRSAFEAFDDLGQLALHAPAPLDDEVWVTKPARYRSRNGVAIYEALANTGMSSVIRVSAIRAGRIMFRNTPSDGAVKLPNDALLSVEIKAAGYIAAWSDRYRCLNIGHTIAEFDRDWSYYLDNYRAKPWLLEEGFRNRLAEFRATAKPVRSGIFGWPAVPHPSHDVDSARLWSEIDGGQPDVESIELLHAYVRCFKPRRVGIYRGWSGHVASAVAGAMVLNGFGSIECCEPDGAVEARMMAAMTSEQSRIVDVARDAPFVTTPDFVVLCGYFDEAETPPKQPVNIDGARLVFVQRSLAGDPRFAGVVEQLRSAGFILSGDPTPNGWLIASQP